MANVNTQKRRASVDLILSFEILIPLAKRFEHMVLDQARAAQGGKSIADSD